LLYVIFSHCCSVQLLPLQLHDELQIARSERSLIEQRLDYLLAHDIAKTDETRAHLIAELADKQRQYERTCRDYEARIQDLKLRHRMAISAYYNQGTPSRERRPQGRYRSMAPFSLTMALPLSFMFLITEVGLRSMYLSYGLWSVTLLLLMQMSDASFDPYQDNGGLVSAIAGRNFAIIATDTRMIGVGGYLLDSRNHLSNRLWSVEDDTTMIDIENILRLDTTNAIRRRTISPIYSKHIVSAISPAPIMVGSSGCSTDCSQLQRVVRADIRASSYFGQMSRRDPDQVANVVSQTLYSRRGFLPYYVFCVVCGLDNSSNQNGGYCGFGGGGGGGKVYVYDAIGSYEQVAVAVAGTGRELLQPILDNFFDCSTSEDKVVEGSAEHAIACLCQAYRSVSEREIGVGDNLVIHVTENVNGEIKIRVLVVPLKEH
jgi:20S proteasome subunit beta 6